MNLQSSKLLFDAPAYLKSSMEETIDANEIVAVNVLFRRYFTGCISFHFHFIVLAKRPLW